MKALTDFVVIVALGTPFVYGGLFVVSEFLIAYR